MKVLIKSVLWLLFLKYTKQIFYIFFFMWTHTAEGIFHISSILCVLLFVFLTNNSNMNNATILILRCILSFTDGWNENPSAIQYLKQFLMFNQNHYSIVYRFLCTVNTMIMWHTPAIWTVHYWLRLTVAESESAALMSSQKAPAQPVVCKNWH